MLDEVFEKVERLVVFRWNIFGHEIEIGDTVLVTWIIMAVLIIACLFLTRRLSEDHPSKVQTLVEWLVQTVRNLCKGSIGHHGDAFVPFIGTLLLYLGLANIMTMFNFLPFVTIYSPTKDINVAGTLALMSIVVVLYASFRYKGVRGWLRSFAQPMPLMIPFKAMEIVTKPLSLCLRLFGNIMAAFIIMEMVYAFIPIAGAPLSVYFDIFDGVLQAFIFVYLTTLYIGEAVE